MRIGYGWDSHEFKPGIPLRIGGVELPHDKGLAGHSDGDVLLHALTDALLGAVAAGDIGAFFPPGDPKWKGANSVIFIEEAMRHVEKAGYAVTNADTTLILAAPKIGPHAARIQQRLAELLKVDSNCVGVKAKTPEGMGTDNAAIAHAVGVRADSWITDVPSRTRRVDEPHHASGVYASDPQASAVNTASKSAASAAATSSAWFSGG